MVPSDQGASALVCPPIFIHVAQGGHPGKTAERAALPCPLPGNTDVQARVHQFDVGSAFIGYCISCKLTDRVIFELFAWVVHYLENGCFGGKAIVPVKSVLLLLPFWQVEDIQLKLFYYWNSIS